jgi:hypothetical protein
MKNLKKKPLNTLIKQGLTKYDQKPPTASQIIEGVEGIKPQPPQNAVEFTREEFDNLKLLSKNNQVLVRIDVHNIDERTPHGIYTNPDQDWRKAAHADRIGFVVKVPDSLYYADNRFDDSGKLIFTDELSMPWKTEMQLKLGDQIWFDYLTSLNCTIFYCEGIQYKLIKYDDIYLAKRGDDIIMLNGYCLFTPIYKEYKIEVLEKEIDPMRGIVARVGQPNKEYRSGNKWFKMNDDAQIVPGMEVFFEKPFQVYLEGDHLLFDGNKYRLEQRKWVTAIEQKPLE